ncbi:MBL fold metallo-hydrolase [Actinomadura alba]|uniref:MBL fold metallo-hydrolase n=1 Tax=Actinomadura alba TaxID=406431 RepID=UPI0031DDCD14
MPHPSKVVAGVEVVPLCDAVGPMGPSLRRPLDETFLGASPEDWAGLDTAGWTLHFHCYLLRTPDDRLILVDTGIGGTDSPAASWAPVPGRLGAELAAAGAGPADVDVVVLTHLHSDHASGSVTAGAPAFPNARYVIQQDELDWVGGPVLERVVHPLRDHLQVVSGPAALTGDVEVLPTPGHTPGHQSVRVGPLVLSGDAVLHPVQLANPAVTYAHDEDPELAATTRKALLERVRAQNGLIGTGHFPEPFTELS